MSRLTIDSRRKIVKVESTKRFNEKHESIRTKIQMECERLVKKRVPTYSEKLRPFMKLSTRFTFTGMDNTERRNKGITGINLPSSYPYSGHSSEHLITMNSKLKALVISCGENKKAREKFESHLLYTLGQFTTVKKLLEAIPELKDHFQVEPNKQMVIVQDFTAIRKILKGKK